MSHLIGAKLSWKRNERAAIIKFLLSRGRLIQYTNRETINLSLHINLLRKLNKTQSNEFCEEIGKFTRMSGIGGRWMQWNWGWEVRITFFGLPGSRKRDWNCWKIAAKQKITRKWDLEAIFHPTQVVRHLRTEKIQNWRLKRAKYSLKSTGEDEIHLEKIWKRQNLLKNSWKQLREDEIHLKRAKFTSKSTGKTKCSPKCTRKCKIHIKERWKFEIHPKIRCKGWNLIQKSVGRLNLPQKL